MESGGVEREQRHPRHLSPEDIAALETERREEAERRGAERPERKPVQRAARTGKPGKRGGREREAGRAKKPVARTAGNTRLFYDKLLPFAESAHVHNQSRLRTGVIWLFVLPVLLLIIRRLTDSSKIAFLIIWIIGMFVIAAFLVFIAYTDHELQKQLNELQRSIPGTEEASLGTLLPTRQEVAAALPLRPEALREMRAQRQERGEPNAEYRANHQG